MRSRGYGLYSGAHNFLLNCRSILCVVSLSRVLYLHFLQSTYLRKSTRVAVELN